MSTTPIHLSSPLRFLIVDDSRAIQAIIRRAVSRCGYEPIEIQTALDGEQALELIDTFLPHLVITDWHMPKLSGLEMVQALRQMGHHNVRVGFVTTEKSPTLLAEAMSNGALFILHKPFEDAELVDAVTASVLDVIKSQAQPPEPKALMVPVAPESLQMHLHNSLGSIPFRLIADDKMTIENLTTNNMLALYVVSNRKGVFAIGVMDTNAVCMIGGGADRQPPAVVRAAMAAGKPSDAMLAKAQDFLRASAACLTESSVEPSVEVSLAKASIVKSTFAKLAEILAQTGHRSDFRVSIPGYGEGRLGYFVVTP
jgi:CheY-like chemotaxis protein